MKHLKWLGNNIDRIFGTVCCSLMILALMIQVLSRYVLEISLPWTEEIALPLFILSIYYGAAAAVFRNQHLRMVVLVERLNPTLRTIMEIIADIITVAFFFIVMRGMIGITQKQFKTNAKLIVTGIPKAFIYTLVIIAFILIIIRDNVQ